MRFRDWLSWLGLLPSFRKLLFLFRSRPDLFFYFKFLSFFSLLKLFELRITSLFQKFSSDIPLSLKFLVICLGSFHFLVSLRFCATIERVCCSKNCRVVVRRYLPGLIKCTRANSAAVVCDNPMTDLSTQNSIHWNHQIILLFLLCGSLWFKLYIFQLLVALNCRDCIQTVSLQFKFFVLF